MAKTGLSICLRKLASNPDSVDITYMSALTFLSTYWVELIIVVAILATMYHLQRVTVQLERHRHESGYDVRGFWNYYRSRWGGQSFLSNALTPQLFILSKLFAVYVLDLLRRAGYIDSYIPELIALSWVMAFFYITVLSKKIKAPQLHFRPSDWLRQMRTPDSTIR